MVQDVLVSPVDLFKALANEKRYKILQILMREREKSVNDLIPMTGLAQSALSQHLARLRGYGLVKTRRSAQTIFYSIKCEELRSVLEYVQSLFDENSVRRCCD